KTCPAAVNGLLSSGWRTQPVPSIAACLAGSARTTKTTSADALMIAVALRLSSAMSDLLITEPVADCDARQALIFIAVEALDLLDLSDAPSGACRTIDNRRTGRTPVHALPGTRRSTVGAMHKHEPGQERFGAAAPSAEWDARYGERERAVWSGRP